MRPPGQIKSRVRAYLERHLRATDRKVAKFIQMAPETAYRYLSELCDDGVAHRTYEGNPMGGGRTVTFNFGPKPLRIDTFDVRTAVKTWAPMRTVDPWMLPREFFQSNGITA